MGYVVKRPKVTFLIQDIRSMGLPYSTNNENLKTKLNFEK